MTRPLPHVDGVEHQYVDAGPLRMHVAVAGPADAPPLLLLHGWPQHWYLWRDVIPAVSDRYRVIAPDLRGFGWTDAPPGGYRKERLATDILALLDALGIDRVRLVGHDWG
ncbi:alpha/beta fold hydrolase, partial [Williamsia sp.]|uniref:alpha/beta fold hydrolase n=1 Tax=Williamsia sp. TaxID=1872085 RepID=UPI001A30C31A